MKKDYKAKISEYVRKGVTPIFLTASLLIPGCASTRYNSTKIISGITETVDGGLVRPLRGADLGTGTKIYDGYDKTAPNYRPAEFADTDKNKVLVGATSRTLSAGRQVVRGLSRTGQGLVGLVFDPLKGLVKANDGPENGNEKYGAKEVIADLTYPDRREGISSPTSTYLIDKVERAGGVKVQNLESDYREAKLIGFWRKVAGLFPVLNRVNNEEGNNEKVRAVGDLLYIGGAVALEHNLKDTGAKDIPIPAKPIEGNDGIGGVGGIGK